MEDLSAIPQDAWNLALRRFNLLRPYLEGARPLRSVTVLTINKLQQFSVDVVETARENLVILPYRRQTGK